MRFSPTGLKARSRNDRGCFLLSPTCGRGDGLSVALFSLSHVWERAGVREYGVPRSGSPHPRLRRDLSRERER